MKKRADNLEAKEASAVGLEITGLWKKYSKKADWAVRDISLRCGAGEIVGLCGHNGAGKSTTLKCALGMLPFQKGEVKICGYSLKDKPLRAKQNVGFVTDNHAVFEQMTGFEYVMFMADIYKVSAAEREAQLNRLEEVLHLGKDIYELIGSYSHGMKQKICMMGSLIHSPGLWVLDEPLTGLDPTTSRAVIAFMREYAQSGSAIVFSSHDLHSVGKICDRIYLIDSGKCVREKTLSGMAEGQSVNLEELFFETE